MTTRLKAWLGGEVRLRRWSLAALIGAAWVVVPHLSVVFWTAMLPADNSARPYSREFAREIVQRVRMPPTHALFVPPSERPAPDACNRFGEGTNAAEWTRVVLDAARAERIRELVLEQEAAWLEKGASRPMLGWLAYCLRSSWAAAVCENWAGGRIDALPLERRRAVMRHVAAVDADYRRICRAVLDGRLNEADAGPAALVPGGVASG